MVAREATPSVGSILKNNTWVMCYKNTIVNLYSNKKFNGIILCHMSHALLVKLMVKVKSPKKRAPSK
jgi:hypothetical protein